MCGKYKDVMAEIEMGYIRRNGRRSLPEESEAYVLRK